LRDPVEGLPSRGYDRPADGLGEGDSGVGGTGDIAEYGRVSGGVSMAESTESCGGVGSRTDLRRSCGEFEVQQETEPALSIQLMSGSDSSSVSISGTSGRASFARRSRYSSSSSKVLVSDFWPRLEL
jgi:hypothetical protein